MLAAIPGFLFAALFVASGFLLVYGAYHRWPFLIDPPQELWIAYSQALVRKVLGLRGTVVFTYCLGVMFMAAGIIGIWKSLQ
jgi:hypothetical protein